MGWHRGQKYDDRFMNDTRRIGVPHREPEVSGSDLVEFSHDLVANFAQVMAKAQQVGTDVVITTGAADTLTRTTAILAGLFFLTCIALNLLALHGRDRTSILDSAPAESVNVQVDDRRGE